MKKHRIKKLKTRPRQRIVRTSKRTSKKTALKKGARVFVKKFLPIIKKLANE